MARKPTLRERNGYWVSYVNGKATYYGKISETPRTIALKRFKGRSEDDKESTTTTLTVDDLAQRFLSWLKTNRSEKTHEERERHVRRFVDANGGVSADSIDGSSLESFTASLRSYAPDYVHKHVVSIGAMFRWASRKGLTTNGTPFVSVEPIRRPLKPLMEAELMTPAEASALLAFADADLSTMGTGRGSRRREPNEYRQGDANPWRGFGDLLRTFYATGARTSELLNARVSDFQRTTRTIVLGSHKRVHTLKTPVPRTITLNDTAYDIVARRCEDANSRDVFIFVQPRNGRPWDRYSVAERFRAIRERACVRDTLTVYSFRHLWISEAMMAGVDVMLIAKMAGTSVRMIETVYGHWRTQSFADAQSRLDASRNVHRS